MSELLKKFLFSILGIVIMLGWWTIRGPSKDPNRTQESSIPTQFWEGGENLLSIDASSSIAAEMRVSMESPLPDNPEEDRWHQATETKPAGQHQWEIRFPKSVRFGTVEWQVSDPKVGDQISWTVKLNGQTIQEEVYKLEKPLEKNYAMFLQVELEDFIEAPAEAAEADAAAE